MKKAYTIWSNEKIVLDWIQGSKRIDRSVDVTWGNGTEITSAVLDVTAETGSIAVFLKVSMNENTVAELGWPLINPGPPRKSISKNVSSILRNGTNSFYALFWKDPWFPLVAEIIITVILTVDYEGEPPSVAPWWEKYVLPAIGIGVGVVGVAGVGYGVKRSDRAR